MKQTSRPWAINGKTLAGWRIDSMLPEKAGVDFMLNPIAIVPKKEDAELIIKLVNQGANEEPRISDALALIKKEYPRFKLVLDDQNNLKQE